MPDQAMFAKHAALQNRRCSVSVLTCRNPSLMRMGQLLRSPQSLFCFRCLPIRRRSSGPAAFNCGPSPSCRSISRWQGRRAMTGEPRDLGGLDRAGFDLTASCRRCRRRVVVPAARALNLCRARGWSTDWQLLKRRFRCVQCGRTDQVRLGGTLRAEGETDPQSLGSPINSIAAPPRAVMARHWYSVDDTERRRLVRKLRS